MAELQFYAGTMDSGKSTMALQFDFTYRQRGLPGRLYSMYDRKGKTISSKIGLVEDAVQVTPDLDFVDDVVGHLPLSYLVCDEVQFYTEEQIEQLAYIVDEYSIDVFAFGILTAFTGRLFPGAIRLLELADRRMEPPVPALCWCGKKATHNAKVIDGIVITEGDAVDPKATYHVVCRKHFRLRRAIPVAELAAARQG